MFGTLDTWILYKLTNGRIYVTDISNASATGFFDLFSLSWGVLPLFLKIPTSILPKVVGNDYLFGETSADAFGQPLSIGCVVNYFIICYLLHIMITLYRWETRWLLCLAQVVIIRMI